MEGTKPQEPQKHTTQQATPPPPVDTYVPPIDPHGPSSRFLSKKYASVILFIICIGIIIYAFSLGTGRI